MATDELMAARLRAAGETWRASNPPGMVAGSEGYRADPTSIGPSDRPVEEPLDVLVEPPRWPRRRVIYAALSAAAVIAVAVGVGAAVTGGTDRPSPSAARPTAIENRDWTIASVDGTSVTDPRMTLRVERGRFFADDSCNYLGGRAHVQGNRLLLGDVATTVRGCLDPGFSSVVREVDEFFTGTITWSVDGAKLTLINHTGMKLRYRSAPAFVSFPGQLVGTWALSGIEHHTPGSSSGTGSSDMANTTVAFDGAGHITIGHRCYVNTGTAALAAESADLTAVSLSSAVPCPATPNQAAEQRADGEVDGVLTGRVTWTIADGTLRITKAGTTLSFTAKK
jgi:heat shock protein HslJ